MHKINHTQPKDRAAKLDIASAQRRIMHPSMFVLNTVAAFRGRKQYRRCIMCVTSHAHTTSIMIKQGLPQGPQHMAHVEANASTLVHLSANSNSIPTHLDALTNTQWELFFWRVNSRAIKQTLMASRVSSQPLTTPRKLINNPQSCTYSITPITLMFTCGEGLKMSKLWVFRQVHIL